MTRFRANMINLAIASALLAGCWISIGLTGTNPSERSKKAANISIDAKELTVISAEAETEETGADHAAAPPGIAGRVHILAAGDNLIHSSIYNQAAARANGNGYDFSYEYDNVDEYIASADIAILNQETLICNDTIEPSDYPYFNSPAALGDHMIDIGFDVFTIANNHILDQHEDGLSACLDYWESRPEAKVVGVYRNNEDKAHIRTVTSNGITFSFLAYTESLNGLKLPEDSDIIIGNAYDITGMTEDIAEAKKISDICIVSLHWGVEDSDEISDTQRDYARRLAEAGADVIIGTHPHVLRDIEMIERNDGGKTLCAYSLGNFVSAQSKPQNLIGGILEFFVDKYDDGTFAVEDISLVPTIQHYDAGYSNNRVYLYSQYNDSLAGAHGVNTAEGNTTPFTCEYIDGILEKNISSEFYSKGE